jgi:hypothetical protein
LPFPANSPSYENRLNSGFSISWPAPFHMGAAYCFAEARLLHVTFIGRIPTWPSISKRNLMHVARRRQCGVQEEKEISSLGINGVPFWMYTSNQVSILECSFESEILRQTKTGLRGFVGVLDVNQR